MRFRWGSYRLKSPSPAAMIVVFVATVSASLFCLIGWNAWDKRVTTFARSAGDSRNLSHSLAQHASRAIEEADIILAGIGERLEAGAWDPGLPARLSTILAKRVAAVTHIRQLGVLDETGLWVASSFPQLPAYSNGDREYFRFHRDNPAAGLRINRPLQSRMTGGWTIVLTRRINHPDGRFAGVVLAAVDLDYFQRFYDGFDIGQKGSISLYLDDGTLLVRRPFDAHDVGRNLSGSALFLAGRTNARAGYFDVISPFDGLAKRIAFERMPEYPALVAVALSDDEILAPWAADVRRDLVIAGLMSGILALMGGAIAAQLCLRARSEASVRDSEARYRLLADNCTDMIFELDLAFVRRYVSPASREILGFAPEELIGKPPVNMVHPEDAERVHATYQAVADGLDRASVTNRIRHRDGRWIWVEAELRLVRDAEGGRPSGILGALRDVSARKAIETKAAAARKLAEEAAAAQGQFLATMSHELRTPLNAILGFADLILDRNDLLPEVRRQVGLIQTAGAFLLMVVNDVLDFSKIEEGKLDLVTTEFALGGMVDNCVSMIRDLCNRKNLDLTILIDPDVPLYVRGDEGRLRQVLLNFLNNAIKFTQEGRIALTIEHLGRDEAGERLQVAISDTGIGIPEDKLHRLFQRFSQVDGSTSREFGGTGLGLAICKRLIELMGGQIGVESILGQGSRFWFVVTLPAASEPTPAALSLHDSTHHAISSRILLVEDVDVNQEIARSMLEAAGHKVDVAADGADAITAVESGDYDVVLMDIQMPVMDGMTATKRIRALPGRAGRVPIIAMTANVLPQQVESFRAGGMNGHIAKPIRRAEMLAAIARIVPAARPCEPARPASAGASAAVLDAEIFGELMQHMEPAKVDGLLLKFRTRLESRLASDPETAEQRAQLAREAHMLISSAGMLGFIALSQSYERLEAAAHGSGKLVEPLDEVHRACQDVLSEIATRLARPDIVREAPADQRMR